MLTDSPTVLTPEDKQLGFIEAIIAADEEWANRPAIQRAVILPLRPGVMIVKMQWIYGVGYQIRVWGEFDLGPFSGVLPSKWNPGSEVFPTPQLAIQAARGELPATISGVKKMLEAGVSAMSVDCPLCHERFEVERDFFVPDDALTCPHCNKSIRAR